MSRKQALYATGLFLLSVSTSTWANECALIISSNDAMQYDTKNITVPRSCKEFSITLKHTGNIPKQAMGHNIVITKTEDFQAVLSAGIESGLANDYIPPNDSRVIAASKLIGGGESSTFKLKSMDLSVTGSYSFFCSFPGHFALMKGTLTIG